MNSVVLEYMKLQKGTNYFGDEGAGSNRIINNEAGHVQLAN